MFLTVLGSPAKDLMMNLRTFFPVNIKPKTKYISELLFFRRKKLSFQLPDSIKQLNLWLALRKKIQINQAKTSLLFSSKQQLSTKKNEKSLLESVLRKETKSKLFN